MSIFTKIYFPNDFKTNHVKALDGVRGLAVLLVVIAHGNELGNYIDFNTKGFGRLGVFIFCSIGIFTRYVY